MSVSVSGISYVCELGIVNIGLMNKLTDRQTGEQRYRWEVGLRDRGIRGTWQDFTTL